MKTEEKIKLVKQVGEEIITEEELVGLFDKKKKPIAYDGFEPSGKIHIAQGVMRAINTNKLLKAGVQFKFWVADWFAWMNNKLGGDLEKIQTTGKYFIEVWKACGMDTSKVDFIWASDAMTQQYWKRTVNIARTNSVKRILRCSQIMGRTEKEVISAAQIFYPCMQCSDIFQLEVDMTNLGMDQRKVNMLAREVGPKLNLWKPVVVNYHMLMGLTAPAKGIEDPIEKKIAMKMSKSKPDSAIFMNDSPEEVKRKLSKAYCPEKETEENPVMEYCQYIIFEKFKKFKIERPAKFGGDVEYNSYKDLEKAYSAGELHPMDLKNGVEIYVNKLLDPVREHFEKNKKARELWELVQGYSVTR